MDDEFEPFLMVARKIFRSDLWLEPRALSRFEAWLDLIASATYAPETTWVEGRCIKLQTGELVSSVRYLARKWGWSKSRVERFLVSQRERDRIEVRNETGINIIKICKYDVYNGRRDRNGTVSGTPPGHGRDTSGTNIKKEENNHQEIPGAGAGLDAPPADPEKRAVWRKSRGYPERCEAVSSGPQAGVAPEAAADWWDNRDADDWTINRISGHATPVSKNWRGDMKRFKSSARASGVRTIENPSANHVAAQPRFNFSAPVYDERGKMIRDATGNEIKPQ